MKQIILIAVTLLLMHSLAAQNSTISGRVIDLKTNTSIAFASISLLQTENNNLVSGAITNNEGRFVLQSLPKGNFKLSVSFLGYQTIQQNILIGELNNNFDVGKLFLTPKTSELSEVSVKGRSSTVDPDLNKKTFYMDDNISATSGSILDAMKSMPGVTVNQEGKVILRGSDKVLVLMDGKQSSITGFGNQKGLDNIPVSNIEKIEIINNPSAKYDASGMAGIINIIYKKETTKGFNGDIGFKYGIGALTKPKIDLPTRLGSYSLTPKYIPSLNLNYRTGKVNFFLQSEIMSLKKLPNNEFTTRYYDDGSIIASQVPENRTQMHYIFKSGFDINFNDNNTLTVSGIYDWERHVDTAQVPYINLITGTSNRLTSWHEEEITGYMNYSALYRHTFPEIGHEISANIQYTKGWEDETYTIYDTFNGNYGNDITSILATEHTTALNIDYAKPLANGRVEAGSKFQIRSLPTDFTVKNLAGRSVVNYDLGNWSKWGENIYSAYVNYVLEKSNYDIEAGLRAEQTDVFYKFDTNAYYSKNDSYNYFELFPNIRFTFKLNANNSVSAFYNRRIDRPGEPELRIFPKSDDQELLKIGNPYLRPQISQSFELAYKLKWQSGSLFLSGYYRTINDAFMRIYARDTLNPAFNVVTKMYANTGSATNSGLELIFSQQVLNFWKLTGSVNFYENTIKAYTGKVQFPYHQQFVIKETTDNTWDFKLNSSFKLPQKLQLQITGIYYAPKLIPQGEQHARSSVDIGIKKSILNGHGELNFTVSDIFNKFGLRQTIVGDGFTAEYENYYETQVVSLGVLYKF